MAANPEAGDAEFEAQLAALTRQFVAGLPARRATLADAWRSLHALPDESAWSALREVAHRLAGSAGSYGLARVGDAARDVDRALSGRAPCRDVARIEPAVERVLRELDAVIEAP